MGGLVVFSPVTLTEEVKGKVASLGGNVSYIVAPDMEHHLHLGPWKAAYPSARVLAPAGLREKRAKAQKEDVDIDFPFTPENKHTIQLPSDLTSEFDVEYFDGHANKEIVMNHRPSRTLIQADLIFNCPAHEQYSKTNENPATGLLTRLSLALFTSLGKGQQRFIWYAAAKDRTSFNKSAKVVDKWDFDRIIPCHGDTIETGGKDVFKRLFAWQLEAKE